MADPLIAGDLSAAWTFETQAVASAFDAHVVAQLPFYPALSQFVAELVASFLPRGGVLYDVGASTGNITSLLEDQIHAKGATTISIEPSSAMVGQFKGLGKIIQAPAEMINFEHRRPNVIVCFLTLMFVSPAGRSALIDRLVDALLPGGLLVIVDKGVIDLPRLQVACKAAQMARKLADGTAPDAYTAKELSLRGTQFPIDRSSLVMNLVNQHEMQADQFFQFGEFFGVAAIKDEFPS